MIATGSALFTVASMVWFQNGRPNRSEYRRFKVKSVEGNYERGLITEDEIKEKISKKKS